MNPSKMFDDPDQTSPDRPLSPADQAREKADEFRMHAELAAVFEAPRKFEAKILPGLDPDLAREIQRTIARLEKSKKAEIPLLPEPSAVEAANLLSLRTQRDLSTNAYDLHRRPGEPTV